jgi:hypothetical protein
MPKCRVYQTSTLRMNNITRENIFFFYSQKFIFFVFYEVDLYLQCVMYSILINRKARK